MSGMAAAYYAQCTKRDLSRRFERTATGDWHCKCGVTLTTEQTIGHHRHCIAGLVPIAQAMTKPACISIPATAHAGAMAKE